MRLSILICFILIIASKISSQTANNFSFSQMHSLNDTTQIYVQFQDTLDLNIPDENSPWLAFLFSYIFPGGGQLYNGQPVKGLLFLTGFTAGIGVALLGYPGADFEATQQDKAFFYSGIGLAGIFYLWQLIDAPVSASSINEKRRIRLNNVEIELVPQITGSSFNATFRIYFY